MFDPYSPAGRAEAVHQIQTLAMSRLREILEWNATHQDLHPDLLGVVCVSHKPLRHRWTIQSGTRTWVTITTEGNTAFYMDPDRFFIFSEQEAKA